ncbi:MAG TPA: DMT family transporter [Streptosporangiaceae bacterium]|nr:DMT family transporter [Streptosporangiaceae bacterium]
MSRRGWVLFASMSVIWGMPYLLIKIAVGGVPVPVLVLARVVIGAAILLPIAVYRGQFSALRPVWRWVALFAVVEIIAPWLVLSEAERNISSSLTGLLLASVPIIVAIISLVIGGDDRLSWVRWAGLLVGLAGVALLAGPHLVGSRGGGAVARSVGEVLFVALCYATGPLIANRKLAAAPPVGMTAACLLLAAVAYAPLAAFSWPSAIPSGKVLASIAGLAVICTALAFLIFFRLIAEAGPARASVITYVNPAIAIALGFAVLGEQVTPAMLLAFAAILAGSVLATRRGAATTATGDGAASAPEVAAAAAAGRG